MASGITLPMSLPADQFPPTQWSLIVAARDGDEAGAARALDQLCRAYWQPLYAFARRWGATADAAPDCVQDFLAHFGARGDFTRSTPERGRFRSFLLTAFQNHLTSAHRREQAAKRGGGIDFIALEDLAREEQWQTGVTEAGPEQAYDLRWAEATMTRAMSRMETDYTRAGHEALFTALRPVLTGEQTEQVAVVGSRFGLAPGAARAAVFRMRAKFRDALRSEVQETVTGPEDLAEEVRYLLTLLAT